MSDSCGYIAVSHSVTNPRIILAFRGTYSLANTVVDLSTIPQEYVPYPPSNGSEPDVPPSLLAPSRYLPSKWTKRSSVFEDDPNKCDNCTVHSGFLTSWAHTRPHVLPVLEALVQKYPGHRVTLVGHSLGGAVAALASLDFHHRGWNPRVITFGEPRVGNDALMRYIDARFSPQEKGGRGEYMRVTHVNDPIPLLPLREWGFRMHAGEVYISKSDLSPSLTDIELCDGDEDPECIASADPDPIDEDDVTSEWWDKDGGMWTVPPRYRMWQLFFAHRDYFWRLGLCVPGGDPYDWYRKYPHEEGPEWAEDQVNMEL
jgi:Lipase (class 3)